MSNWKEIYKEKVVNEFVKKKVLVIGDLMVDEYITGRVRRISPEAPVPVLDFKERKLEAGGASNVAHNIKSLGAEVTVSGTAAEDQPGMWLREHFRKLQIHTEGIVAESGRPTTLKTRFATKGQQLLRMDNENAKDITPDTQNKIYAFLKEHITDFDAVVLSDYKKGVLNNGEFVQSIIQLCQTNHVLISIDSKSRNIAAFKDIDFVKPNNLELEEAVGIRIEDEETLNQAGEKYLAVSGAKALVVTRGSKGISLFKKTEGRLDFPAKDVQVYDVCGAGDTVISTISLGMISGMDITEAIQLANLSAGVVITKVGTVAVTPQELLRCIDEE